jgi:SagB-type dehydrogenase family enzyme
METNQQDIRAFHKHCYHIPGEEWDADINTQPMPELFKKYEGQDVVVLPEPDRIGGASLWKTIQTRRSHRKYSADPLSLEELSQLLFATVGISEIMELTRPDGTDVRYPLRVAPSGGARYCVETYLDIQNIEDLDSGIYHYYVPEHQLVRLKTKRDRMELIHTCLDQDWMEPTPVVFIFTSIFYRQQWKYKTRGARYAYMEAGSISENLYLAATGMGLGTCAIGAFYDEAIHSYLQVDGENEFVTLVHPVGRLHEGDWKQTRR